MRHIKELLEKYILNGDVESLECASALYEAIGGIEGDEVWCDIVNNIELNIN